MSLFLLIRANQYPVDKFQWLKFDARNQITIEKGELEASQLTELRNASEGCFVIFIIPGQLVHAFDVELPFKKKNIIKSLPFIVEENLSEPIESMHIVAGSDHSGKLETFAISHHQMQYWQDLISEYGIDVHYFCADYQLLKRGENLLWVDNARTIVSTDDLQGNLGEATTIHYLLKQQSQSHHKLMADSLPLKLNELLPDGKATQSCPTHSFIEYAAKNFSLKQPPTNLMTGIYQTSDPLKSYWSTFKKPLVVAACLVLLGLGQLALENFIMEHQIKQLDLQMVNLYKEAFPQSLKVPDPVRQMRAKLNQSEASDPPPLLPWLAEAAPLLARHQIRMTNLRYDQTKNTLKLQLTAPDFNGMEQLNNALQAKGLKSELGTLVKNKDSVSGLLTLGGS